MVSVGFIGAGIVGTALAFRLKERRYPVVAVSTKSKSSAQRFIGFVPDCRICSSQDVVEASELIFLTTPDDAIERVASSLTWSPGKMVAHTSGAASLDVLWSAKKSGALVGSFHPLQTFASIKQAIENLPGSFFTIEAEGRLREVLKEMALSLGGRYLELEGGQKHLYHLSAVLACNYWVALVDVSASLWRHFGLSKEEALAALLPLLHGTLNNLENLGLPHALTGPIARGDIGTIKKHQEAIKSFAPQLMTLYKELGKLTIPIGICKGTLDKEKAKELERLLV